jgi:hypothetical protein
LAVVDWLTKYSHFIPIAHMYTVDSIIHLFLDNLVWLHGLPLEIISRSHLSKQPLPGNIQGTEDYTQFQHSLSPANRRANRTYELLCWVVSVQHGFPGPEALS